MGSSAADAGNAPLGIAPDIREIILTADPERWLALGYAKAKGRRELAALFALDITLGGIVASTREMMIGAMRLAWWREALEKLGESTAPAEPILQALSGSGDASTPLGVDPKNLAGMTDGWLSLLEVEQQDEHALTGHARQRGGRLFNEAARLLGCGEQASEALRMHGEGWALADFARRTADPAARTLAVQLAQKTFGKTEALPRLPAMARPLMVLSSMARHDVKNGCVAIQPGSPRRQMRMLKIALFGR